MIPYAAACPNPYLFSVSHSDEASASAAIPAGQGGRFPTDVWGTPPGGEAGVSNNGSSSRWRRRRRVVGTGVGGTGEARTARHPDSEGTDSGSIVDRRLPRYTGRGLGPAGVGGSSQESLLAGRTAEAIRTQQQQLRQQQQQQQHPRTSDSTIGNDKNVITANDRRPAAAAREEQPEDNAPIATGRQSREALSAASSTGTLETDYNNFVVPTVGSREKTSTISDWTTTNSSAVGGVFVDAAGRDSEWLAERRAADREAKDVLRALKHNSSRLSFLVGSGY